MVAPGPARVNEIERRSKRGVGGWLLLLCLLLLVGQPITLAVGLSGALDALAIRGVPMALVMIARVVVTAVGIAAGIALAGGRPAAVTLARWSLVLSAGMDMFVYATPFYPSNRPPGATPVFVAVSLTYSAVWLAYLARSERIRRTFLP